jgi:hypothetical protein
MGGRSHRRSLTIPKHKSHNGCPKIEVVIQKNKSNALSALNVLHLKQETTAPIVGAGLPGTRDGARNGYRAKQPVTVDTIGEEEVLALPPFGPPPKPRNQSPPGVWPG